MIFKRQLYKELLLWKNKDRRKPLLIMGARQIGKTTLLKEFGNEYKDVLYINLERQTDLHSFFTGNKDPKIILANLSLIHGKEILPDETLIILDEIQECRDALISLKYFQEEQPDIHITGAGSLLGLSIGHDRSFPVGKVEFLDMFSLTFEEYLLTSDPKLHKAYHHFVDMETISPLPEHFYNSLSAHHKEYLLFGGMPEVAAYYLTNRDIAGVQKMQEQILRAYELDFVKHANKTTSTRIQHVWQSLPSQLAKENKKFLYKAIRSGARAREYEVAIQWLIQAGFIYKISKIEKPALPIKSYEDISSFKLFLFETGLLMHMAGLSAKTFIDGDTFFLEYKGALAENYVAQSLQSSLGKSAHYWSSNGKAEVDFIFNNDGDIVPIEVKSGKETKAKSLATYKTKYQPKLRIRISALNLKLTDDLLNIPLFYVDEILNIINKVKKN